MGDGDVFIFDVPLVTINGNLSVDAEGSGKIVIPAGVTVVVNGNFQLDSKNGQCSHDNPCAFEIEVNGAIRFSQNFQNNLVNLIWSGAGSVAVDHHFENSSNACMSCSAGGCPRFQVSTSDCQDKGSGCSGQDFCATITSCSSDVTPPVVTDCPADQTVYLTTGCSQIADWIEPSASDNCTLRSLSANHSPGSAFPKGITTVTYTATDANGNTATCSFNVNVIDSMAPTLTGCPADITVNANASCQAVANWSAPSFIDNCEGGTLTSDKTPGSIFNIGRTKVTYTATDAAGNTATCSFNVNVIDNTPPTLTGCPADITVNANASCQAVANWSAPSFIDNCEGGTLTSDKMPGTIFNIGSTKVTYTATDAAGNTSTCTFNVIVTGTAPIMTGCPGDITTHADALCQARVSWDPPTARASCSAVTITSTYKPGDLFAIGVTPVTYTARNEKGNSTVCTFNVIVRSEAVPVISDCPNDILLRANDDGVAYANWNPPTASVTCGEIVMTSSHQPGDAFNIGTTAIEYKATDGLGNAAYCTFNVVVTDPEIQIDVNQLVTPDGDGINDEWTIANIEKFKDNEVVVVDRWGSVIFVAKGYNNQSILWRGANRNGQLVPTGTYFYSISVKHRSSKLDKKGFIEVVR